MSGIKGHDYTWSKSWIEFKAPDALGVYCLRGWRIRSGIWNVCGILDCFNVCLKVCHGWNQRPRIHGAGASMKGAAGSREKC